ncbi:PAS domain S-box protein [Pedobacter sp. L105]|uniref:PAS domain S-box protein n=1 Tax=Pedobacter sp. L105 TaxID=1641871 RepID=UPI00131A6DB8|nr:PAS domain S-box protein [Pedobacter sp. L105]
MNTMPALLSEHQLLEVLNATKTATAVHIGEEAVIQMANDAMLNIWGKDRSIIGKSLAGALPELVGQPFIEMFARVWREGLTLSGNDTAASIQVDGEIKTFYFDFEYRAIKDEEGNTICVLHTAVDVTEQFLNREVLKDAYLKEQLLMQEQAINEELATANEELSAINEELAQSQEELSSTNEQLEQRVENRIKELAESEARFKTMAEGTDILISVSDESSAITYLNQAWYELTGLSTDQLLNFGWTELIHPDDKRGWIKAYLTAFELRIPFEGELRIKSKTGEYRWMLIKAPPRFRSDQSFAGYISSCVDITDRKNDELEKTRLAGDLAAINEELTASNEELHAANEELISAQEYLNATYSKLAISENRVRQLITAAPIGIAVLNGQDLIVESVNEKMLEIWGKDSAVIGSPLGGVLTAENERVLPILEALFANGKAYYSNESQAKVTHNGVQKDLYFNVIFQPLTNALGKVDSIIITATDVTEQVLSRQKVEEAEVALRLAIEAANFGTWHIHSVTRKFITSARLKELFGFYPEEDITIEDAVGQITEEYREYVSTILEAAIAGNGNYDVSYPVLGFHDQKIRWLRAMGNLKADPSGEFSAFTGVVMDISEMRKDDERKNAFIGMVSHELKTPLTSLKGYVQILQMKVKKEQNVFTAEVLDKASRQVQKMTSMINGFLNISRLESGKIVLDKSAFRLDQLLGNLIEEARLVDSSHHFTYLPSAEIEIIADEDKIGNVISNLLSNAVKYSPSNSEIKISCSLTDGMAQITVTDQGIGIEAKDIEKLFERYYRVEHNNNISGFGIGLYLSAEIAARHNGKIWVESEPGQGATFYFVLPVNG